MALDTPARAADDRALAEFCREQHPKLMGAMTLYTGDRHLAEELVQETLARVVLHWRRVAMMDSPAGWAHRVAVNLANSTFRRSAARRRAMARLEARPLGELTDADTPTAIALRDAIVGLPERQRAALVLRYYADLAPRDVGRVMGCAEGTVWALVHQAIASLRGTPGFETMEATDV